MRVLIFFSLVLLASCTAQKRRYQKGYHVQWLAHKGVEHGASRLPNGKTCTPAGSRTQAVSAGSSSAVSQDDVYATADEKGVFVSLTKKKRHLNEGKDSCDQIFLRDGKKIEAKIIEIGRGLIKYKPCDNLDGPLVTTYEKEISVILYANGSYETFTVSAAPVPTVAPARTNKYDNPENVKNDAVLSFLLGLIGLIFIFYGSLHAIILGFRVLRVINSNPALYAGKGFAVTGIVLGILKLAVISIVIAAGLFF